jgi:hypothetical protein
MENYYWKIISLSEAKKLFKKKSKVYQLYEDESYTEIENDSDLNDCKESKSDIGIKCYL